MGGGGSDDYQSTRAMDRLQKVAQDELSKAQPGKRNVFISFDHRDLTEVNLLRGQAKNENSELEFNDYSLRAPFNSERAEYIKNGIRERIRQSSVTLIYVTEHTHESKWVEWEAKESRALGKGVICVHKGDSPPARLPKVVSDLKLKVIPWKQASLTAAINDASESR